MTERKESRHLGKRARRGIAVMRIMAETITKKPDFTVQDLDEGFKGTLYQKLTRLQLAHYIALLQRLGAPIVTERVRVKNILDEQDVCFRSDPRRYHFTGSPEDLGAVLDDLEARPN